VNGSTRGDDACGEWTPAGVVGAVRRGDFPSSAQPEDRLPQCTQRRNTVPGSHQVLNS
jgi:hypothetical protein